MINASIVLLTKIRFLHEKGPLGAEDGTLVRLPQRHRKCMFKNAQIQEANNTQRIILLLLLNKYYYYSRLRWVL